MKHRCEYLNCPLPPTKTVGYWGTRYDLCDEHEDLLGDDGSMPELVLVES